MPDRFRAEWTWQQKNQYFQERFADRLIAELTQVTQLGS
jgi:hypothetical protein